MSARLQEADFGSRIEACLARFDRALNRALPPASEDCARLHEAMRYTCNGGKRLRALLVYASGETLGLAAEALDAPAVAVELIHAYSLVHDDLPTMDDDDLRRGQPTVHKAYDEATAILVGDALQTLAFEVLTVEDGISTPAARLQRVAVLAAAAGSRGMVGGQMIDIESEGQRLPLDRLQSLHARKTGALIVASVLLAIAKPPSPEQQAALTTYGRAIGLAFQIQDDVLDVTASTAILGKTAGKDLLQEKSTYPALLGLDAARRLAAETFDQARTALALLPDGAPALRWIADWVEHRQH